MDWRMSPRGLESSSDTTTPRKMLGRRVLTGKRFRHPVSMIDEFTRVEEPPLSSEQLETLRSLGYLR